MGADMLSGVRIQHFKAFSDTGWLRLAPLTILVGANNAGKSSVLQALLFVKQMQAEGTYLYPVPLDGPLVELGGSRGVTHSGDFTRPVSVEFGAERLAAKQPKASLKVAVTKGGGQANFHISEATLKLNGRDVFRVWRSAGDRGYRVEGPQHPVDTVSLREKTMEFTLWDFLTDLASEAFVDVLGTLNSDAVRDYHQWRNLARRASQTMSTSLWNLHRLGPLRAAPRRVYSTSPGRPHEVGESGEFALDVLLKTPALQGQVADWLEAFGLASGIRFKKGRDFDVFSASVVEAQTGQLRALTGMGFGLSQLLPLLVEAASVAPSSTLLVEQPEIHLHPAAQSTVGRFLVGAALTRRQMIVETHSEHLVLGVQREIAAERVDPNDVIVYYVSRQGAESSVRELPMTGEGLIEWPKGFFDESVRGKLELQLAIAERHSTPGT